MTVGELIAKLQELPADQEIFAMDNYWAELVTIDRVEPFAPDNPSDRDHGKFVVWPGVPV